MDRIHFFTAAKIATKMQFRNTTEIAKAYNSYFCIPVAGYFMQDPLFILKRQFPNIYLPVLLSH
jgi:hypothetical protein